MKVWIYLLLLLGLLVSCSEDSRTRGSGISAQTTTDDNTDQTDNSSLSYFQNGSVQASALLTVPSNFQSVIQLRGSAIDQFVTQNPSQQQCLAIGFSTTTGNKTLLLRLAPDNFTNFSTQSVESFYFFQPAEQALNSATCQPSLFSAVFSNSTLVYQLTDVCPTCTGTLTSTSLAIYSTQAVESSTLSTSHLTLAIGLAGSSTSTNPTNNACTQDNQCSGCCVGGQCVTDGQLIAGVDITSTAFLDAQAQIAANPSSIINYTHFFHLCITGSLPTGSGGSTGNNGGGNQPLSGTDLLEYLSELHACTTTAIDELAICTKTYDNATSPGAFTAATDDLNFTTINPSLNSNTIVKVTYGGDTLALSGTNSLTTGNDEFTSAQGFQLNTPLATTATHSKLKISYQVDGSCERLSPTIARCKKTYTQGQSLNRPSDHSLGDQDFLLPFYANVRDYFIQVSVDGSLVASSGTTWSVPTANMCDPSALNAIRFVSSYPIQSGQKVEIIYHVDASDCPTSNPILTSVDELLASSEQAQTELDTYCTCSNGGGCWLTPVYDVNNVITNYTCTHPAPVNTNPTPLNQTLAVSGKNVPLRYFDTSGVSHDTPTLLTPAQEGSVIEYVSGNLNRPNTVYDDTNDTFDPTLYKGFNEIYGSFSLLVPASALAAKVVSVEKNKIYTIYTNSGTFSSCPTCGSGPYGFQKIFPQSSGQYGGGYEPQLITDKIDNASNYRADDLLFGRACFVPATIIPWTHETNIISSTTPKDQRQNRLQAQHFLFTNGYQRDWYGFDYGSLIGSWDGVNWFSVGTERRIQAKSKKLFLAVNAYFGDLNDSASFSVTINEFTGGTSTVNEEDDFSTGAQCRQYHYCITDKDCAAQLGPNYLCENVATIKTPTPNFDDNANELVGFSSRNLRDLIGGLSGQNNRCVYRGRGAPCHASLNESTTYYNGSTSSVKKDLNACAPNHYCAEITAGVVDQFNLSLSRFAKPTLSQNLDSDLSGSALDLGDTFGLGARLLGRPLEYQGRNAVPAGLDTYLAQNQVTHLCLPGRNPTLNISQNALNAQSPGTFYPQGDKLNGLGMSLDGNGGSGSYVNSCPTFDDNGDYFSVTNDNANLLTDTTLIHLATAQNFSTNFLAVFENGLTDLIQDNPTDLLASFKFLPNTCLKAAGATCFSNLECAPNKKIVDQTRFLNPSDVTGILNEGELKFWQEELVCAQEFETDHPSYDLANNRCCREVGNTLTAYTDQNIATTIDTVSAPGTDIPLNDSKRYSRYLPLYELLQINPTDYPALITPVIDGNSLSFTVQEKQWNTLHHTLAKTCCSKNWVRNFANNNGGGNSINPHAWNQTSAQKIDKTAFRCLNWDEDVSTSTPFECTLANYNTSACKVRNILPGSTEEKRYFNWLDRIELLGIPQIMIYPEDLLCRSHPDDQGNLATAPAGSPYGIGTVITSPNNLYTDFHNSNSSYELISPDPALSAADETNFDPTNLTPVFSANEFSCCLPVGQEVPIGTADSACCTGKVVAVTANGSSVNICALPDYTNVSVYLNRFVSSEAAELDENLFDEETGYLKNPIFAVQFAVENHLCASGKPPVVGEAIQSLKIPGAESAPSSANVRRFVDGDDLANQFNGANGAYNAGLRWNHHVYCVP